MGYRGYRCVCSPGSVPGGTLAIDLNDGDDFLMAVRARRFAVAVVARRACLPPSISVIVTKLAEFRVQTASRINEWVPTISERVSAFVAVEAMPPVFSEGSSAGRGREKAAPEGRVVGLKRGTNGETLCKMMFL